MRQRFESMLNMCPKRAGKLLIVVCFCITLLIGSVFATSETIPVISATQTLSPTTGMLYPAGRDDTYRPVLIEISNSKGARPPLAISLADIVYEYIFWGPGNTRYLALYNDYHPEMVGAIRSSRSSSISLRNSWDCPIVYWGEENNLPEISVSRAMATNGIPQSMQFDGTDTNLNSIFSRTTMRESPHNTVANLQVVVEENWPTDAAGTQYEPALPTLHFSSKPTQSGAPVTEISIPYDEQDSVVRYIYDVAERHYKRWQNGSPQFDGLTGQRIIADNVVVLYAELAFYDNNISQPLWNFTGEGKLDVFISGRHIHGTWLRAEETSTFEYFEENGNSLLLKPGKTFIQIVPLGMKIELSD